VSGDLLHAKGADARVTPFQYWMVTFNGDLLRKHRRERNLSQQRLAYRSRVSLKTVQRIEKLPAASCRFATLHRIARALSPDPDALISELTADVSDAPAVPALHTEPPRWRPDPWWQRAKPFPADRTEHGRYDAALARELLKMTGEFPNTKNALLILLVEYRRALYDIAAERSGTGT